IRRTTPGSPDAFAGTTQGGPPLAAPRRRQPPIARLGGRADQVKGTQSLRGDETMHPRSGVGPPGGGELGPPSSGNAAKERGNWAIGEPSRSWPQSCVGIYRNRVEHRQVGEDRQAIDGSFVYRRECYEAWFGRHARRPPDPRPGGRGRDR